MTEHQAELLEPARQVRSIPLWKASIILVLWLVIIGFSGMFIGNKYFWSGIDFRQLEREITYYRQLVDMEPDNPEHRVSLGYTFSRLGNNEAALAQLQVAVEIDKNYYDAYLNLGYVNVQLGYWDDALAAFERTVELSPRDYKGHFNLGIVYRELDMIDASYEALNNALALRSGASDVLYNLALTAQKDNDIEQAKHYLERALAFDPRFQEANLLYRQLTQ